MLVRIFVYTTIWYVGHKWRKWERDGGAFEKAEDIDKLRSKTETDHHFEGGGGDNRNRLLDLLNDMIHSTKNVTKSIRKTYSHSIQGIQTLNVIEMNEKAHTITKKK